MGRVRPASRSEMKGRAGPEKEVMNTKLYVGNLSARTTEEGLRFLFSKRGSISAIKIVIERSTGRSRAFAIVTMATAEGAEAALFGLHRHIWNGRHITVNAVSEGTVNEVSEGPHTEGISTPEPMPSRWSLAAQRTISPFFPIKTTRQDSEDGN
jgi:RNA recognition motif-containing protein